MNKDMVIKIEHERRLCIIDKPNDRYNGTVGLFHEWEQYSTNGFNRMYAIVELPNEVRRFEVSEIRFVDTDHDFLTKYDEAWREQED